MEADAEMAGSRERAHDREAVRPDGDETLRSRRTEQDEGRKSKKKEG